MNKIERWKRRAIVDPSSAHKTPSTTTNYTVTAPLLAGVVLVDGAEPKPLP